MPLPTRVRTLRDWADQLDGASQRLETIIDSDDLTHGTLETSLLEDGKLDAAGLRFVANGLRNMARAMDREDHGHALYERRSPGVTPR